MGTNQQFSLRWNNYLHHITDAFDTLREDENLVDVTLCCEGRKIKAHKMLLSACSGYFREIFKDNPCQHPVIVFHNVKYDNLLALVSFMYRGEVNVEQDSLSSFLNTAELLEVQGLTGGPSRPEETEDDTSQESRYNRKLTSPGPSTRPDSPAAKRQRPLEDSPKKDSKPAIPQVKTEPDFYIADSRDSQDDLEDQKPQCLSLPQQIEQNFDNSYSDENIDGISEQGTPGGTTNELTNMQDSLQAPKPVLHRCAECGKTFKHSGSLSMHKRLHVGDTYCNICGRVFSRKYYLKLHMKMHHFQASPPVLNVIVPKTE